MKRYFKVYRDLLLLLVSVALLMNACKKDVTFDNQYKDWKGKDKPTPLAPPSLDIHSIQGLHFYIFKPTCSNSGCHDGTFEPDFRTTESAYNSLVNVSVIKEDASAPGKFLLRVEPGNADNSMLLRRCRVNLGGNSGTMPLAVDNGSDWLEKKDEYLARIEKWINDGAKDQFGNAVPPKDLAPQMAGMVVKSGSTAFPRNSNYSPVEVPVGTGNITVYFAYIDDNVASNLFTNTTVDTSSNPFLYNPASKINLTKEASASNMLGLFQKNRDYWHSMSLNVANFQTGQVLWFKTTVSDNVNGITEIPSEFSNFNNQQYFAIRFN